MELRQLEAFVKTVEQKSFSEAAKCLYLSQPTVSSHIHALEKELQTRLIHRTTKQFQVTPEGQRLYDYASAMLRLHQKALSELSSSSQRELHIGASSVPGQCILPGLLAAFQAQNPQVQYHVVFSDSMDLIQQTASGLLDFSLVGVMDDGPCTFLPLADDELVAVSPNTQHYQALQKEGISPLALLAEPLIMRTGGSGTQQETERFLEKLGGTEPNIVARMGNAQAILQSAAQGLGIAIVSRQLAEPAIQQGTLLCFSLGEHRPVRTLYGAYRPYDCRSAISQAFIRFVTEQSEAKIKCLKTGEMDDIMING